MQDLPYVSKKSTCSITNKITSLCLMLYRITVKISLQCSKAGWNNNSECTMHGACDSSQEPGNHCFLPPLIMHCNPTSTVYALLTTDNEKCMTEIETFTLYQTSHYRLAQPLSCKQHFRYAHRKLVWFNSANLLDSSFKWTDSPNRLSHHWKVRQCAFYSLFLYS